MENKEKVKNYLKENGSIYIEGFEQMSDSTKSHIVNISLSILESDQGLCSYSKGSFVTSILNNDLNGAINCADSINRKCIEFYVKIKNNLRL